MDLTCSLPLQKLTRCERSKSWVPQNWLSPPLTLEGLEIPYPIPEQHLTLPTRCSDTDSVTTSQQPASLSLKGKTSSLKTRFEIAEAWCRLLTRFWPEGRLHSEQHPCWGCVYATTEVRTFGPSTLCWLSTLTKWLTATKENHHDDLNTEKIPFFKRFQKVRHLIYRHWKSWSSMSLPTSHMTVEQDPIWNLRPIRVCWH